MSKNSAKQLKETLQTWVSSVLRGRRTDAAKDPKKSQTPYKKRYPRQ